MMKTSMFYIMDGNGNYYRINNKNQLVAASDRDEAELFDFRTANERIGTGKKARFYYTIPADDLQQMENDMLDGFAGNEEESKKEVTSIDTQEAVSIHPKEKDVEIPTVSNVNKKSINEYDIENIDWLSYMQHFTFLAKNASGYFDSLNAKLSDVDKEMCDLLHYIELYDLSEEEMIEVTERIKDTRIRRREIKDEATRVQCFRREFATNANLIKANSVISQMQKLENRTYHPRHIFKIFEGMNGRETDKNEYCRKLVDEVEEYETKEEVTTMEYSRKDTALDGKVHDWLAFAKQQSEFYDNALQYMMNLKVDMDEIDAQIEETLIMIENANFNVTQGYKAFKQLKDLRNEKKEKQKEYDCLVSLTKGIDVGDISDQAYYAVQEIEEILGTVENEGYEEVSEEEIKELVCDIEEVV